ncbi:hypothetical protein MGG_07326 [Pyricularia oryzae 70-15]|uniref:Benzoylformate decarboxylase n=3 Tax=Pyricularia oryzae TaxID=318829 RepID=G4MV20_PYRO7|nr:uncharacterized protein MGG_07326 [Pyricularia oryzae 70-15]EHA55754.1 hypothetical protein MGG_07326 [Pyricularia oryzae 70-15]ELQ39310.1 hypothetical protein OOU_Y34scaffold00506g4 [Pyricularia oryzae Y34]KAI7927507.1 hypothetical protein M9X92_002230 [Pyricularia oryzae]KAI7932246.1 hypothetical protein M0657_000685 [Pyricularia oryzae]
MESPTVLTTIHTPPKVDDFTPLAEHQERTPATFFGGKPVLHYHAASATVLVPASQKRSLPIFRTADAAAGSDDDTEVTVEQTVDVFVNSSTLTLFSQDATVGVQIPYPQIGIHAVKTLTPPPAAPSPTAGATSAVYMQLDLQASGGADDDDFNTVELTIIPAAPTTESTPALFAAISACAELHPDPADADDDDEDEDRIVFESAAGFEPGSGIFRGVSDGGLPPAMPGSSGWITADNVNEFFDEDGNWIGGEEYDAEEGISGELGEGAGRVRGRDEVSGAEQPAAANGQEGRNGQQNGAEGEDSESKRQRTD